MSVCSNKRYENEYLKRMIQQGYHCERVAGSGSGDNAVCDCILFKDGEVWLVEVKATKEPKLYLRANIKRQLEKMTEIARKSNVRAILAIKYKHRGWEEQVLV
ncbi:MAG: hypothetical protein ACOCZ6_05210 [Nanoarchaeota archaeon]